MIENSEEMAVIIDEISASWRNDNKDYWNRKLELLSKLTPKKRDDASECYLNKLWYLHEYIRMTITHIDVFELIRVEKYYKAWCDLENIEIKTDWLLRNNFIPILSDGVLKISKITREWQSIFPYRLFASPEILHKKVECSICAEMVTPWSGCQHRKGLVYMGIPCVHIILECEIVAVSIVTKPVQKYSVIGLTGDSESTSEFNYKLVKFVRDRLRCAFDRWSATPMWAFHPERLFHNLDENSECPCGSGKIYFDCCRGKGGVSHRHYNIEFEIDPPQDFPNFQLNIELATK